MHVLNLAQEKGGFGPAPNDDAFLATDIVQVDVPLGSEGFLRDRFRFYLYFGFGKRMPTPNR